MSPQRKRDVLAWLVGILVGSITIIGASSAGATQVFVTHRTYDRDRVADSAWKAILDHRTLYTLCALRPADSECVRLPR